MHLREYQVKRKLMRLVAPLLGKTIQSSGLLDMLLDSFRVGVNENDEFILLDDEDDFSVTNSRQ